MMGKIYNRYESELQEKIYIVKFNNIKAISTFEINIRKYT
jgi:hypothetical protein